MSAAKFIGVDFWETGEDLKFGLLSVGAIISAFTLLIYSADLLADTMKLADFFGILGTFVGIAGFSFAIWQLSRVEAASEAAKRESILTLTELESVEAISAISEATHCMEIARRRYFDQALPEAIENAGRATRFLRKALTSTRMSDNSLQTEVSLSIAQANEVREALERAQAGPLSPSAAQTLHTSFESNILRYSNIEADMRVRLNTVRESRVTNR